MEFLIERLSELITSSFTEHTECKVMIIDDDWDDDFSKTQEDWDMLINLLTDTESYDVITTQMSDKGINPDDAPPDHIWKEIKKELPLLDSNETLDIISKYDNKKNALHQLKAFLTDMGLQPSFYADNPSDSDINDIALLIVDYQIGNENYQGEKAQQLLKKIMEISQNTNTFPPIAILMSKNIEEEDTVKWTEIAEKSGYYRFNYDFLSKSKFMSDNATLGLILLNLLQNKPIADAYYQQIKVIDQEASKISKSVVNALFQISPPEVEVFKTQIENEGTNLSDVLLGLFTDHFSLKLKACQRIKEEMEFFEKVISEGQLPPPNKVQKGELHKLYTELLYQKYSEKQSPPSFGDIYKANGSFGLIISQECDLAYSETRSVKASQVLAISGEISDSAPKTGTPDSITATPWIKNKNECCWVW